MGAAPWDPVRLAVLWWDGPLPVAGDGLKTTTGRRYLVTRVRTRATSYRSTPRPISALDCVVLPAREKVPGRWFEWRWGDRGRRNRKRRVKQFVSA